MRADLERTLRFWLDHGVDGFRIDVLDPRFDNDDVHEIHRMIRTVLEEYPGSVAVGEIRSFDDEWFARCLRPDELHLGFNFRLIMAQFDFDAIQAAIERSLAAAATAGAPATWTLANHDVWRQVSRYGGGALGLRRAHAMALVELALPGVVYLYNGEELGLSNADTPAAAITDPKARIEAGKPSRDAARVPIPWEGSAPPFAFSSNDNTWLPMPEDWAPFTVEAELENPKSTLSLYRKAISLRGMHSAFDGDEVEWYGAPAGCFAFRRSPGGLTCVLNTSASPVELPPGELLLASTDLVDGTLPADAAAWLV